MAIYNLDLDQISCFTGLSIEQLKTKSYAELEQLAADAKAAKKKMDGESNLASSIYWDAIQLYFTPFRFLERWWTKEEIVYACANTGVERCDLISEKAVPYNSHAPYSGPAALLLRTSYEYIPQYTKSGQELMDRKRVLCDVYKVKNEFESLVHGKVIKYLLEGKFPELKAYDFSCYSYYSCEQYEIYPKKIINGFYVPFAAMLEGDVDTIIKRNTDYCKSYNHGNYTPKKNTERLNSQEVGNFLEWVSHNKKG